MILHDLSVESQCPQKSRRGSQPVLRHEIEARESSVDPVCRESCTWGKAVWEELNWALLLFVNFWISQAVHGFYWKLSQVYRDPG
jgi:hypothetical protein